jgi:hypothetical protein
MFIVLIDAMAHSSTRPPVARGLAALFTALWYVVLVTSVLVALTLIVWGGDVGLQLGPHGEPNFDAGGKVEMVLPIAFQLDAASARAISTDLSRTGSIEHAAGMLRFPAVGRPWLAIAGAALMMALALWVLAELAALCGSVRDGRPFVPINVVRIRRLAFALVLAEAWRAVSIYVAKAYVAAHFAADHVRFTAWPEVDVRAIISALILLVLAEVFRTGTRLDEDQSLTV